MSDTEVDVMHAWETAQKKRELFPVGLRLGGQYPELGKIDMEKLKTVSVCNLMEIIQGKMSGLPWFKKRYKQTRNKT